MNRFRGGRLRRVLHTLASCLGCVGGLALLAMSCRSAGPIRSLPGSADADPRFQEGYRLYMGHCAACHGRRGLGDGPAAIALHVRPRDFWNERFRYVSTLNGVPTQDDLRKTILSGRHFGAMPARPSLTDHEVEILVDYVREINRRGWIELLTAEFGDDDETTPEDIEEIARARVTPRRVIKVRWHGPGFRPDLAAGRNLYMDYCASCHGRWGRGDGLDKPEDELGKPISVRDLTSGEFRGGVSCEEIFTRIRCGVPGTPMPAQPGLKDEEIWQLVHYVEFLAGLRR